MKVKLYKRHCGVHSFIKECEIEGTFRRYGKKTNCEVKGIDYTIKEEQFIKALPKDFLPTEPKNILLTVDKKDVSTGIVNLKLFRNWAKYFDAYSIALINLIATEKMKEYEEE